MKTIILSLILTGVSTAELPPIHLPDGTAERLGISVSSIPSKPVGDPIRATGKITLDPVSTAIVASRLSGQIADDPLRVGTEVRKDQEVMRLRSSKRASSVTRYLGAEQNLRFATAAYERGRNLAERKLTSTESTLHREAELTQARTEHLAAIQDMYLLGISEGSLHLLIDKDPVRDDLSTQSVTSPLDGLIISKETTPGAPVEENQVLFTVANLDHLLVDFQVPLRAIDRISEGLEVRFETTVGLDRSGTAKVIRLIPSTQSETLSAPVMALLENPDHRWIPGTPVEILLNDPNALTRPAVPVGSVVEIDGQSHIFLAEDNNQFRPHPVEVVTEASEFIALADDSLTGRLAVTAQAGLLLAAWEENNAKE